ncbi:TCF4 [Acrasis kona]|uniref:TCF4 n=1 Tax=Acrasis kona TaxID=1008807 RepID=A0AAW2ZC87_9EUKA
MGDLRERCTSLINLMSEQMTQLPNNNITDNQASNNATYLKTIDFLQKELQDRLELINDLKAMLETRVNGPGSTMIVQIEDLHSVLSTSLSCVNNISHKFEFIVQNTTNEIKKFVSMLTMEVAVIDHQIFQQRETLERLMLTCDQVIGERDQLKIEVAMINKDLNEKIFKLNENLISTQQKNDQRLADLRREYEERLIDSRTDHEVQRLRAEVTELRRRLNNKL